MQPKSQKGFTIVELLIVIVVIGILAAITLVAFSGVRNRANDSAVQSDLRNFHSLMAQHRAINGTYPATLAADLGIRLSRDAYLAEEYDQYATARYCYNSATDNYILYARSKSGNYFRIVGSVGSVEPRSPTFGWGICSQIGLVEKNPTHNGFSVSSGWAAWVN